MAAKDFPASPVAGQVFENWVWNATNESWDSLYNGTPPAMLQVSKYADASARTTAIPTPAEGMITYLDDINQFQGYQGASWRPVGGLVPIVPPTVNYSGGTATANTLGVIAFSAVSSISLNNVFTSSYKKYKIIFEAFGSTGPIETLYRWRTSGVDKVINYFGGTTWTAYNSGPSAVGQRNNDSNGFVVPIRTAVASQATLEVLTKSDNWNYTSLIYSPHYSAGGSGGYECPITTADGFTILTASGTMTGTVRVYAYNE